MHISEGKHYRIELTMNGDSVGRAEVESIDEARYFAQAFIDMGWADAAEIFRVEPLQVRDMADWLRENA